MQKPYVLLILVIHVLFLSGCSFQLSSIHNDGIYADIRKEPIIEKKHPTTTDNDKVHQNTGRFQNPTHPSSFSWSYFDYGINPSFFNFEPYFFSSPYSWNGINYYNPYHLNNPSYWWMYYPNQDFLYSTNYIYNRSYRTPNYIYRRTPTSKSHSLNYRGYNERHKVQYNQSRKDADNDLPKPIYHNRHINNSNSSYQTQKYQNKKTKQNNYSQPSRNSNSSSRSWNKSTKNNSTRGRGRL